MEDLKFLPEPRFSGAWQPNGATEKHLSQFTERACGDSSLPRTLDACSPRSSGPVSEGGVLERRPPKIKGKETGSAAAVSQRRRECASVW